MGLMFKSKANLWEGREVVILASAGIDLAGRTGIAIAEDFTPGEIPCDEEHRVAVLVALPKSLPRQPRERVWLHPRHIEVVH